MITFRLHSICSQGQSCPSGVVGRDCPGQGCGLRQSSFWARSGLNQFSSDPWVEVKERGQGSGTPRPLVSTPSLTPSPGGLSELAQHRGCDLRLLGARACWTCGPLGRKGGYDSPSISLIPVQTWGWAQGEARRGPGRAAPGLQAAPPCLWAPPRETGCWQDRAKAPGTPRLRWLRKCPC